VKWLDYKSNLPHFAVITSENTTDIYNVMLYYLSYVLQNNEHHIVM